MMSGMPGSGSEDDTLFHSRAVRTLERRRREDELRSSLGEPPDDPDAEATVALLGRAKDGDKAAGNQLFERYYERLQRYVRIELHAHRQSDAEDIVQESCLKMLQGLESFEYRGKDSLYAYLKRIAYHLVLAGSRPRGGKVHVAGDAAELEFANRVHEAPSPSMLARSAELRRILDESMAQLPPQLREVLLNRQVLQAPSKVVAQWMGLADEHQVNRLAHQARVRWLGIAAPRLDAWMDAE